MRRLEVNRLDLEEAFETGFLEIHYYLDTETGKVLMVQDESRRALERLTEEAGPDDKPEDLLRDSDLPDWQKQALAEAHQVEEDYGTRVVEVRRPDAHQDIRDMAAFASTVPEPRFRAELQRALNGRGAFRRFRDALGSDSRERERWFQFKRERLREHMTDWLASLDIESLWEEAAATAAPAAGAHPTARGSPSLCSIGRAPFRGETDCLDRLAHHSGTLPQRY